MATRPRSLPRKLLLVFLGLISAVVLLVLVLLAVITTPFFAAKVGAYLTHQSGRNIALDGSIEYKLWQREPRIILHGVKVGNAEWSKDPSMFEAERIEFSIRPLELLRGRVVLPELILDKPHVVLEKNLEGAANWELTRNAQAAAANAATPENRGDIPVIRRLEITDGEMTYRDPKKKIDTTLGVSTVHGESEGEQSLTVQGKGSYQSQPFLLDLSGGSMLQLRESETPYPFSFKTTVGSTVIDAEGTVQDPVKMERLDVTLHLKGKNAAELFPITGIVLPRTPPYSIEGHLTSERAGAVYHFENFKGRMGDSDLRGDLTWHADQKPPYLEGKFLSESLDMKDLAGFVGADRKPAGDDRVIPDEKLDTSRLGAMNADVVFHGKRVQATDLMHDFHMDIGLKDSTLTLHPLSFSLAQGSITANIVIEGKATPPKVNMDVTFRRLSLAALFEPLARNFGKDNVTAGFLGGKANLKGEGRSLREILAVSEGDIGVGMEGGRLSNLLLQLIGLDIFRSAGLILTNSDKPVEINCVVGDYKVESGIMQTREFLIDTDVTTLRSQGTVNLKDESLDIDLTAHPKEASPLSARTPIHISGKMKKPSIGLDVPSLAARVGAATALGVVATPIASLLAFVNPGLGEDSNCARVIRELGENTGAQPAVQNAPAKSKAKKKP